MYLDGGSYASVKQFTPSQVGSGQSGYTATGGETLQQVAQSVYGNAALWYSIMNPDYSNLANAPTVSPQSSNGNTDLNQGFDSSVALTYQPYTPPSGGLSGLNSMVASIDGPTTDVPVNDALAGIANADTDNPVAVTPVADANAVQASIPSGSAGQGVGDPSTWSAHDTGSFTVTNTGPVYPVGYLPNGTTYTTGVFTSSNGGGTYPSIQLPNGLIAAYPAGDGVQQVVINATTAQVAEAQNAPPISGIDTASLQSSVTDAEVAKILGSIPQVDLSSGTSEQAPGAPTPAPMPVPAPSKPVPAPQLPSIPTAPPQPKPSSPKGNNAQYQKQPKIPYASISQLPLWIQQPPKLLFKNIPLNNLGPVGNYQKLPGTLASTQTNLSSAKNYFISAAKKANIDVSTMMKIGNFESGFDPTARPISRHSELNTVRQFDGTPAMSSAYGYGQFIDGTWTSMINKYGTKYGIAGAGNLTTSQAAAYRTDPAIQADMLAEYTKENINIGLHSGGIDIDANTYAIHNLGVPTGPRFLAAMVEDPDALVNSVLSADVITRNQSLYGNGTITLGEAYSRMGNLMRSGTVYVNSALGR